MTFSVTFWSPEITNEADDRGRIDHHRMVVLAMT